MSKVPSEYEICMAARSPAGPSSPVVASGSLVALTAKRNCVGATFELGSTLSV